MSNNEYFTCLFCTSDDAPYKVFFSQSEYRVEEFSGALDVEIEVDRDHTGTNITVMIEVVSKEGSMYASGLYRPM